MFDNKQVLQSVINIPNCSFPVLTPNLKGPCPLPLSPVLVLHNLLPGFEAALAAGAKEIASESPALLLSCPIIQLALIAQFSRLPPRASLRRTSTAPSRSVRAC